jgi:hypothetical protein
MSVPVDEVREARREAWRKFYASDWLVPDPEFYGRRAGLILQTEDGLVLDGPPEWPDGFTPGYYDTFETGALLTGTATLRPLRRWDWWRLTTLVCVLFILAYTVYFAWVVFTS